MNSIKAFIFRFRHFFALIVAILGFYIIKKVTLLLFIKGNLSLTTLQLWQALWQSHAPFLRMIAIMNLIIKPLFIYYLTLIAIFLYTKSIKH